MMRFPNTLAPGNPNVVSAAPQLFNRGEDVSSEEQYHLPKSSATIEAKAQMRFVCVVPHCSEPLSSFSIFPVSRQYRINMDDISFMFNRNLNADVTRFLPTSVRIKRDDAKQKSKLDSKDMLMMDHSKFMHSKILPNPAPVATQPSKDDAYMQFMREMEGLL